MFTHYRRLFALVLCLLLVGSVAAQDITETPLPEETEEPIEAVPTVDEFATDIPTPTDEPTPEPEFISTWRADTAFPVGIVFEMGAILPVQTAVDGLRLTITPEGAPQQVINIDLGDADVFEQDNTFASVLYVWEPESINDVPILFSEVEYRWDMLLSNGVVDVVESDLTFDDPRIGWLSDDANNVPLTLYTPEGVFTPRRVFDPIEQPYVLLSGQVGALQDTLTVMLFTPSVPLGCNIDPATDTPAVYLERYDLTLPCDMDFARDIYAKSGFETMELSAAELTLAQAILVETLVQRMYAPLWGESNVPDWFTVGLSRLYAPTSNAALLAPSKVTARGGQIFSLVEMSSAPPTNSADYDRWEGQSFGMVAYMADRFRLDAVYTLARDVSGYESFETAYADITGESLGALLPSWQTWIFSRRAEGAYALDIYGSATLTPTAIASATPIPPTATPTATPTRTPIPPPSATPLDPTASPTVTPRPASSVFTPTAYPILPEQPLVILGQPVQRTTLQGIFIALMLASSILVFMGMLFWLVRRYRRRR